MKTSLETLNETVLNDTNGGCAAPPPGMGGGCDFWIYIFGG